MGKHKHSGNIHKESLLHKIWRGILSSIGPLLYLVMAILPWLDQPKWQLSSFSFQSLKFSLPEFPSLAKLPKLFFKEKDYATEGGVRLQVDPRTASGSSGFRSTVLEFGDFSLRWTQERPLVLILADGSKRQLLPTSYSQVNNGFILQFSDSLQLKFYDGHNSLLALLGVVPSPSSSAADSEVPDLMETTLQVELTFEPTYLPSGAVSVHLPWDLNSSNKITQSGGNQIQLEGKSTFAAIQNITVSAESYIEIPLSSFAFLDLPNAPADNTEFTIYGSKKNQSGDLPKRDKSPAIQSRTVALLWQEPPNELQDELNGQGQNQEETSQNELLYQRMYQYHAARLYKYLAQKAQAAVIGGPDMAALYLELALENGHMAGDYESARAQIQQIAVANNWSSMNLAPYLGISRADLRPLVRSDRSRIELVRGAYRRASWSFTGQLDLAELLFNYGTLRLLPRVIERAVEIREEQNLSEPEQFYVLGFLWLAARAYPRNGVLQPQDVQQELRALLERIAKPWQQGFPTGLSSAYVLDVLKILQREELGMKEWTYPIVLQLLALLDSEASLPQKIMKDATSNPDVDRIPYYRFWHVLGSSPQRPRSTAVVPGFWMWTAGSGSGFFEPGEPIEMEVENFPAGLGNKLLLFYGVYFYPEEVTVNGEKASAASQIPAPQLGQRASWYYDRENRLLALEIPASQQDKSKIIIR